MSKISVVIPCYRSEKTISKVVEELLDELNKREEYSYEIILVNDDSPDNVWDEICSLANKYKGKIRGIALSTNFGQHSALMAGYGKVTGDIIVTMDDDGQASTEDIWKLVDRVEEGFDVVYAKYPELKENLFRRLGSYFDKIMSETLIGKPKNIKGTSYNAIRRYVIDEMVKYDKSYPYIGGLVYRTTKNIGDVEIVHKDRLEGTSGYSLKKLLKLWINGFTSFSVKPLRAASILGLIFAGIGFISGIVIIIRKLCNPDIYVGYSSMMATILFVSGVIMTMLGIIGEYIGRIYICISNAPQYVIKEIVGE